MYPNPQEVLPLPARPSLEQYRKQAKDLVKACASGGPDAIGEWIARWLVAPWSGAIEAFAREQLRDCKLTGAQFVIARAYGFTSWTKFAAHLSDLERASTTSSFERAADAIVAGDVERLTQLLREQPDLVRARSTREHRATLLIYVSANGVENYRQKTPQNIVEIAKVLLDAGADVEAEADVYGGEFATLSLVATSLHPDRAGVQNALMQLLIERGALIDHPRTKEKDYSIVNDSLRNGRPGAAHWLADHGARLDLEGAAGTGHIDVVRGFFDADGRLKPPATERQMRQGLGWAANNGHVDVVEFLLDRGVDVNAPVSKDGHAAIHAASIAARTAVVRLLIARHAALDRKDPRFRGTPLNWALHGWSNAPDADARERAYEVVAMLVRAGAPVEAHTREMISNERMLDALRGEL